MNLWLFKRNKLKARVKQLEREGYENHGEITTSDGTKITVLAKPAVYSSGKKDDEP